MSTTLPPVRPPTLRDVAREAGVHPATASRALNPATRSLVNGDTVTRVQRVADALGYRPNPIARSLKTSRSATVGLVIPDLTNPLFPPIVRGIEDVLAPAHYNAWLVNTDNDAEREESLVDSLRSRQVEGLIVATARLQHPLLDRLQAEGVRMVLINRRTAAGSIPSVTADDANGIDTAVEHLTRLGHRRIAHLAGPQDTSTGVVRRRAFVQAMRDHDLEDNAGLVADCASWTEAEGARALRELLDAGGDFTAVVAGNDLLALGCYDVFHERGIRCPRGPLGDRVQRHAVPGQAATAADQRPGAALRGRCRGGTDAARRTRGPDPARTVDPAADHPRRALVDRGTCRALKASDQVAPVRPGGPLR